MSVVSWVCVCVCVGCAMGRRFERTRARELNEYKTHDKGACVCCDFLDTHKRVSTH